MDQNNQSGKDRFAQNANHFKNRSERRGQSSCPTTPQEVCRQAVRFDVILRVPSCARDQTEGHMRLATAHYSECVDFDLN